MVQSICKRQSIPRLLTYFVTRKLTENEMCMEFRFAIKKSKMSSEKPKKKKLIPETEADLIAEVQRLRMENEYLKKLNVLVQERIARENGKEPPSSTN